MRPLRLSALALLTALTACAGEELFIDQEMNTTVAKPRDTLVKTGRLDICYDSKDKLPQAQALAEQTCAAYGLQSRMKFNDLYQCRINTPHQAIFQCFDPDMTTRLGEYINPFDENAVKEWRLRTGGKKEAVIPRGTVVRGAAVPEPKTADAPPPAQLTPAPAPAQLTPAPQQAPAAAPSPAVPFGSGEFNPPRPVPQAPTIQPAPPPPPPPGINDQFQLPMGSWGQSFDKE